MTKRKHDEPLDEARMPSYASDEIGMTADSFGLSAPPLPEISVPAPILEIPMGSGELPKVSIQVFVAAQPNKWDQMVGFASHAKRAKLGPLTIPEWSREFIQFMGKPVR
jgi:hypothetical protein